MTDLFLFRSAVRDMLRPRRVLAALLLIALPNAIALLWRFAGKRHPFDATVAYNTLEAGLVFGFTLVILSVVFSTGVVSQELEQKTIVYLLTRPVPRWRILLAKFLAAVLAVLVTASLASALLAVVCFGGDAFSGTPLKRDLLILPVGALAYGALFLALSTLVNRPLLWGLLFTFGWESWVPGLPGAFKKGSLMAYLRVLAPHPAPESETVEVSALLNSLNPTTISNRLAWEVLIGVTLVSMALALLAFSRREYVPREDAE